MKGQTSVEKSGGAMPVFSPSRFAITVGAASALTLAILFVTHGLIAPAFSYQGYVARNWGIGEVARATGATLLLCIPLSRKSSRASAFAVAFLTATVAIPLLWIPVYYGPLDVAGVFQLQAIVVLGFAVLYGFSVLPFRPIRLLRLGDEIFLVAVMLMVLGIFVWLFLFYGLRPAVFTIEDVYDQRDEYNASIGRAGRYLIGGLTNALLPVLVVWGVGRRRLGIAAVGILGFILAYSMTGFKSFIIGAVLTLVAILLVRFWPTMPASWLLVLAVAVTAGFVFDRILGSVNFSSILTRRAITTSGLNTSYFVDFFSGAEKFQLRHSFLSFLGEPPYALSPARLIGSIYYNSDQMSANANILADGYANFGFLGALGACFVAGGCLWFYDKLTSHLPTGVAMPALILVLVAWANTAVFTTLVTHGGILLAVLVALMPWKEIGLDQNPEPPTDLRNELRPRGQ